jgi:non-heme chloroperoxidase
VKTTTRVGDLELISHVPKRPAHAAPLLFVHGAFVGAWCWEEYFLPYFAERGFAAHALSLRGHGRSAGFERLASASLDDYEADVQLVARHIGGPLVVIGHSMGATIVQRCLHKLDAVAAVLMASVPPEGLLGSSMLLAARDPGLFAALNRLHQEQPDIQTILAARRAVFSDHLEEELVIRHLMRMQPESQRAILDLSWPQHFFIGRARHVRTMVLGADSDAFFTRTMIHSTALVYGVAAEFFEDTAHVMMLEPEWRRIADRIAEWLESA